MLFYMLIMNNYLRRLDYGICFLPDTLELVLPCVLVQWTQIGLKEPMVMQENKKKSREQQ